MNVLSRNDSIFLRVKVQELQWNPTQALTVPETVGDVFNVLSLVPATVRPENVASAFLDRLEVQKSDRGRKVKNLQQEMSVGRVYNSLSEEDIADLYLEIEVLMYQADVGKISERNVWEVYFHFLVEKYLV